MVGRLKRVALFTHAAVLLWACASNAAPAVVAVGHDATAVPTSTAVDAIASVPQTSVTTTTAPRFTAPASTSTTTTIAASTTTTTKQPPPYHVQWLDPLVPALWFDTLNWRRIAGYVNAGDRRASGWRRTSSGRRFQSLAALTGDNPVRMVDGWNGERWTTVVLDTTCEYHPERFIFTCWSESDPEFTLWHEVGRILPAVWGEGPAEEQKAQCVAEAIIGRPEIGWEYRTEGDLNARLLQLPRSGAGHDPGPGSSGWVSRWTPRNRSRRC